MLSQFPPQYNLSVIAKKCGEGGQGWSHAVLCPHSHRPSWIFPESSSLFAFKKMLYYIMYPLLQTKTKTGGRVIISVVSTTCPKWMLGLFFWCSLSVIPAGAPHPSPTWRDFQDLTPNLSSSYSALLATVNFSGACLLNFHNNHRDASSGALEHTIWY